MIFRSQIVNVEEDRAVIRFTHGQELGPHMQACHELRLHDTSNGMSTGRQFQLAALLPDIVVMKLLCERPEVFKDGKEMSKWLRTDEAKPFRTSRDPVPIRGDSLQLIIRN